MSAQQELRAAYEAYMALPADALNLYGLDEERERRRARIEAAQAAADRELEAVRIGLDLDYGAVTVHQARAWLLIHGWCHRTEHDGYGEYLARGASGASAAGPMRIVATDQRWSDRGHVGGSLVEVIARLSALDGFPTANRVLFEMALLPREADCEPLWRGAPITAANLREVREHARVTLGELARELGITTVELSDIERGNEGATAFDGDLRRHALAYLEARLRARDVG